MRYRLRTLLIVLALGPIVLWLAFVAGGPIGVRFVVETLVIVPAVAGLCWALLWIVKELTIRAIGRSQRR